MKVTFEDETAAGRVKEGMNVTIGETSEPIVGIGRDSDGKLFVQAQTGLEDGTYEATVNYKTTQVLGLLFNDGMSQ